MAKAKTKTEYEDKKEVIESNRIHDNDTGSSEVQISILTNRINHLVEHLKNHHKDHHTRRGLITMVSRRRKLLSYLRRTNLESFTTLTKKLKIKVKEQN